MRFTLSNHFIFYLAVVIAILLIRQTKAADEDDDDDEDRPKSCAKYFYDFSLSAVTTLLKCVANLKPKSLFEYVTRSWCIFKCVFQEFGTIDENGKLDEIATAFFFEKTFAPEVQSAIIPNVQDCFAFASLFDNNEYWCKSYSNFAECTLRATIAAFVPYSASCFTNPLIGTILSALKFLAPNSPPMQEISEDLKRQYQKQLNGPKCLNKNCTTKYKIQKYTNGTLAIVLYDRNMTEISRSLKKPKAKVTS